jgi:hypothetical protein
VALHLLGSSPAGTSLAGAKLTDSKPLAGEGAGEADAPPVPSPVAPLLPLTFRLPRLPSLASLLLGQRAAAND